MRFNRNLRALALASNHVRVYVYTVSTLSTELFQRYLVYLYAEVHWRAISIEMLWVFLSSLMSV